MNKASELREMSDEHLALTLKETTGNLFHLRLQAQTERLDAPSELRKHRRMVARIQTVQSQRKQAAEKAVRSLAGVKGLTNLIVINPKATTVDVEGAIKAAYERHALLNSQRIQVNTNGGKVVLSGNVRTSIELEEAERAAWAARGVTNVENNIVFTI